MGCTPSIHVSQTGVVYCREAEDSASPPGGSSSHNNISVSQTGAGAGGGGGHITTTVTTTVVTAAGALQPGAMATRNNKHEAPHVRQQLLCGAGNLDHSGTMQVAVIQALTEGRNEVNFGPMRLAQQPMSVLVVCAVEDAQCNALCFAAKRGGYKCDLLRNAEGALECYLEKRHDLVLIDARSQKYFDQEALCRSIRATKESDYTVIVAVTKQCADEPSILPLLKAGFNRRIQENVNENACLNELLILEHTDVRAQVKLHASQALFTAVESSADPIEITSEDFEIQYVNPSYERLLGYSSDELLGKDIRNLTRLEKNKHDVYDTITSYLKKGKVWEGTCHAKRRSGDTITHHCHTQPVLGQHGKLRHVVTIRNPTYEPLPSDKVNGEVVTLNDLFGVRRSSAIYQRKGSLEIRSISSEGGLSGINPSRRRESLAKFHSISIEAPITKVINIINAAQENSPSAVAQALDKVLEILRSADQDIYSPASFGYQAKEDPMTHDLVGGLMTQPSLKGRSRHDAFTRSHQAIGSHTSSPAITSLLNTSPDIKALLEKHQAWDFDILSLERLTEYRPLTFLALKTFQHWDVMEFLRISSTVMYNWLQMIESKYWATNTYHNSTHAADVMQATSYFLQSEKLNGVLDQMDVVVSLLSAVIHDVDHPGRTNSFLVNANSPLALMYNDLAVLESHHAAIAFQLTRKDERVNIFKNLERDDYRVVRQQVVDMVLATDMTKHFEHLNKFISSINNSPHRDEELSMSGKDSPDSTSTTARLQTPENKTLIKRMLIKCADVSNPLRPLKLSYEWAQRISEEYFKQTDEEKEKGLPVVMAVFDRTSCNMPKSQISFIDFFINDMFDAWDAFCGMNEPNEHLASNYKYWKEQEPIVAEQFSKKLESKSSEQKTNTAS